MTPSASAKMVSVAVPVSGGVVSAVSVSFQVTYLAPAAVLMTPTPAATW